MRLIVVVDFLTSVIAVCTTKNVRQVATDFRSCISRCRRFSHTHEDVATDFPKCCQHIFARTEIYWHRAVLVLDLEASRRPSTLAVTIPNQRLRKKTRKLGMGRGSEEGGPRSLNVFSVQRRRDARAEMLAVRAAAFGSDWRSQNALEWPR